MYARVVSASPTATGSFCQNINRFAPNNPKQLELYTLSYRVRSAPGQPAGRGALELWEMVAPPGTDTASVKQQLITSPTWTEKSLSMCAARNVNSTLRVKVYPYGTNPIDVDNVRLTSSTSQACQPVDSFPSTPDLNLVPKAPASNLPGGSFDFLEERWGNCLSSSARYRNQPGTGFANFEPRSAQAFGSRGGFMATNVSAVDGNRLCRNFLGAPINSNNTPQTFTVWVRSEDGSLVDSAIEVSGHIRQFDSQCGSGADVSGCGGSWPFTVEQKVTATNLWKQVTVTWWPPNLDQGAGTYPDTFSIAVRPLVAGKTILFDEATQVGPFGPNACSSWSWQGCRSPGSTTPGGPGGVTTFPVFPLLSAGRPALIHDDSMNNCLALTSYDGFIRVKSPVSQDNCSQWIPEVVTPFVSAIGGSITGYALVALDGRCIEADTLGVRMADCRPDNPSQAFRDLVFTPTADRFLLKVGATNLCLTRSPGFLDGLSVAACNEGDPLQIWVDLKGASLLTDRQGVQILAWYLFGNGTTRAFTADGSFPFRWESYMQNAFKNRANGPSIAKKEVILAMVLESCKRLAGTHITEGSSCGPFVNTVTAFDFDNGENIYGYNYMSGSNSTVGGFRINGFAPTFSEYRGAGYWSYNIDLSLTFNDIMNPNYGYASDSEKVLFAKRLCSAKGVTLGSALCNPTDYIYRITWKQRIQLLYNPAANTASAVYL
jgi:hypothetical protein